MRIYEPVAVVDACFLVLPQTMDVFAETKNGNDNIEVALPMLYLNISGRRYAMTKATAKE